MRPPVVKGAAAIARAQTALERGELVGIPTETVYGLAADASSADAVARIFAAKGRPLFNPLIAHVASIDVATREGVFDERAQSLAAQFWPGPITLVVPVAATAVTCELARAGLPSIALRMPDHPLTGELLSRFAGPLVAPSANPSGRLSPTSADEVARSFGAEVALIVDGGRCAAGIESTIIALMPDEPARLLRPGAISREAVEAVVGRLADLVTSVEGQVSAPGQLSSHYAPEALLRLNAAAADSSEVLLGFGPDAPTDALNLSVSGDTVEAAANLYYMLRQADAQGARRIAVMPIPDDGLGEAINDRLRRAAAPRDE